MHGRNEERRKVTYMNRHARYTDDVTPVRITFIVARGARKGNARGLLENQDRDRFGFARLCS